MYPPYTPGQTFRQVSVARVATAGTTEETLISLWIPPNILRNDGDYLWIHGSEILAANTNSKTSRVVFGPLGTGIAGRGATDSNSVHDMRAWVYRTSPNTVWTTGLTMNLSSGTQILAQTDITIPLNQPLEIKLAATGTAPGDMTSRVLSYAYFPVGSNFQF